MIKIIKKAPAPATLGKGVGVEESKRTWSQITSTFTEMEDFAAVKSGGLTPGRLSATVKTPNETSRNRRLALAPQGAEVLSAHTAIFHAPAGEVSGGWYVIIGGVATSSIREDWRSRFDRGVLWPRLSFLISIETRYIMSNLIDSPNFPTSLNLNEADLSKLELLTREALGQTYFLESWLSSPDVLSTIPAAEKDVALNLCFETWKRIKIIREKLAFEVKAEGHDD